MKLRRLEERGPDAIAGAATACRWRERKGACEEDRIQVQVDGQDYRQWDKQSQAIAKDTSKGKH